ncbi:Hypothetical protein DAR_48 [Enterococcus phage dArtagnan]|uniref:Uncharacterized protein n=1 Tax=Enterococcus phage dArtagnan TaxID=2795667 RepID=A0A8D6UC88_9CAUD|nr:Hypothetical protein DAR_48 [Enterococcus phage dArtagnan]
MIKLRDYLSCVDIDETILQINGVEYLPQQLASSFYSEQIDFMKISELYVNPNNMITAVIQFD